MSSPPNIDPIRLRDGEHMPIQVRVTLERMALSMQQIIDQGIGPEVTKEVVRKAFEDFDFQAEVKRHVRELLDREIHHIAAAEVRSLLVRGETTMGRKVAELAREEIRRQLDLEQGDRT